MKAAPVNQWEKILLAGSILLAVLLLAVVYVTVITVTCIDAPGATACTRVLFIGNSFTQANDLPGTFAGLARSGGHKVDAQMVATGGWMLAQHAASPETQAKIQAEPWNYVVLQEQSQVPAVEQSRQGSMYPGARSLVSQVKAAKATPIFFQTWAHSAGWPENGMPDYESMQAQIDYGYQTIAQELGAPIAPAGDAWRAVRKQYPQLNMYQDDGYHPDLQGTYLAACVFYAAIFRQSPLGLGYTAGLPVETARVLQTAAASVVLQDPQQWNLP